MALTSQAAFDAHLRSCATCRQSPIDLCQQGVQLLDASVRARDLVEWEANEWDAPNQERFSRRAVRP
jgi:hypothetical protein